MPEAKAKMLADLASAHVAFKEAILHIPNGRARDAVLGDWTAKDVAAHISSWDEVVCMDLQRLVRGHLPVMAAVNADDVDEWNAVLMKGRFPFPFEQVLSELEECYDMLFEELESVPYSMFKEGGAVERMMLVEIEHYKMHAAHVREWREKAGI
jgi:hypothetical protein